MRARKPCADGSRRRSQSSVPAANATRSCGSKRYPNATPMRGGDGVIVAAHGAYRNPRPAVIVQSNAIPASHASVVICQLTSELAEADFRITIEPGPETGIRTRSQVMADKPVTIRRERIGRLIGRLGAEDMARVNGAPAFVMGLAG